MDLYSPAQAARMVGVSASTLRNYAKVYADHLSATAVPEPGQPRQFSADDLQLIHFVSTMTSRQLSHSDVLKRIEGGELATYEGFTMPGSAAESATPEQVDAPGVAPGAIVLLERYNELQRELGEATGRADQLERENARLTELVDRLLTRQSRAWWKKLLGID